MTTTAVDSTPDFILTAIMQFESLKVYCDLVETKSFTKAAQANEVTQSAVSQTISALEAHFNARLVERSKKNFRLTSEGQVLYDYSKRMLQTYGAIHSKMQELKHVVSGPSASPPFTASACTTSRPTSSASSSSFPR